MADDWQVGDLALCVDGDEWWHWLDDGDVPVDGPKTGSISTVRGLAPDEAGDPGLLFVEWPGCDESRIYEASCFRKVTPEEADDFDLETIELMNRKPVGEPVA